MEKIVSFNIGMVMFELQRDRHPRHILLNRLGCIMVEQGKDSEEAELYMRGFLKREDENDRFMAFYFLSALSQKNEEVSDEIKKFEEDPNNKHIF